MRAAGNVILASVAGFLALASAAMAAYPGGSWLEQRAASHDFWRNFLCDVLGPVAINRQPNPLGSALMISAMLVMAVGLATAWWAIPWLFTPVAGKTQEPPPFTPSGVEGALGRALRISGMTSMVGLIAVPLTPPTVSYAWHAAAVFGGGAPALLAWTLAVIGLWRAPKTKRLGVLGAVALASVAVALGLYALALGDTAHPNLLLPVSHRVATALFVAWLLAVALALRGSRG
jgi:hypothetical protein